METADRTAGGTAARAGRLLARVAAVAALALLLAGLAAGGAEARPRRPEATRANDFIFACVANGGEPSVYDYGSSITVVCEFPDGTWVSCGFEGRQKTCIDGSGIAPGSSGPLGPARVGDAVAVEAAPAGGAGGATPDAGAPAAADGGRLVLRVDDDERG